MTTSTSDGTTGSAAAAADAGTNPPAETPEHRDGTNKQFVLIEEPDKEEGHEDGRSDFVPIEDRPALSAEQQERLDAILDMLIAPMGKTELESLRQEMLNMFPADEPLPNEVAAKVRTMNARLDELEAADLDFRPLSQEETPFARNNRLVAEFMAINLAEENDPEFLRQQLQNMDEIFQDCPVPGYVGGKGDEVKARIEEIEAERGRQESSFDRARRMSHRQESRRPRNWNWLLWLLALAAIGLASYAIYVVCHNRSEIDAVHELANNRYSDVYKDVAALKEEFKDTGRVGTLEQLVGKCGEAIFGKAANGNVPAVPGLVQKVDGLTSQQGITDGNLKKLGEGVNGRIDQLGAKVDGDLLKLRNQLAAERANRAKLEQQTAAAAEAAKAAQSQAKAADDKAQTAQSQATTATEKADDAGTKAQAGVDGLQAIADAPSGLLHKSVPRYTKSDIRAILESIKK